MSVSEHEIFQDHRRSNWVKLRTLVVLRWIAIAGQTIALIAAANILHLEFEIGFAAIAVGCSVIANLFVGYLAPEGRRLSESEATLMLLFDLAQVGALIYLTGGLNNPFAVLILVPVTIAATFLNLRATALIGLVAVVIATILALSSLPIITPSGDQLLLPLLFRFGFWVALIIGIIFLATYARVVTGEMHAMSDALLATQMALAREQKLTDLGGVVAAAAHELGTPLATIKLVSGELLTEAEDGSDAKEDLELISAQTDRCRDILRSMGAAGKGDKLLQRTPLDALVREAAEPHMDRGKDVIIRWADKRDPLTQPVVERRPEIIHGLRNLIQNAVDFSSAIVEVETDWSANHIAVRITDDGRGFPASVLGRIGDPFVRKRSTGEVAAGRPGYEGMGLGLFIAKTLLERSGARLIFSNRGEYANGGALVVVSWPRDAIDPTQDRGLGALGENTPNL